MLKAFPRVAIGTAILLTGCQSSASWMVGNSGSPRPGSDGGQLRAAKADSLNKKGTAPRGVETFTKKGREQLPRRITGRPQAVASAGGGEELRAGPRNRRPEERQAHHGLGGLPRPAEARPVAEEHYKKRDRRRPRQRDLRRRPGGTRTTSRTATPKAKSCCSRRCRSILPFPGDPQPGDDVRQAGKTELAESTFRRVMNDGEVRQAMAQASAPSSDITLASGRAEEAGSASAAPPGSWEEVQASDGRGTAEPRSATVTPATGNSRSARPASIRGTIAAVIRTPTSNRIWRTSNAPAPPLARPNGPVYLDANGIQPVPHQATVYPSRSRPTIPADRFSSSRHLEVPGERPELDSRANSPPRRSAPQPTG